MEVMELNALQGMSARERNKAKRKAKLAAKKSSKESSSSRYMFKLGMYTWEVCQIRINF